MEHHGGVFAPGIYLVAASLANFSCNGVGVRCSILRVEFVFLKRTPAVENAYHGAGRHISTRVDEGRKCSILLAIKHEARTAVRRGGKGLL